MKKALPLMIASLLPLTTQAEVIVYGKANVSFQNADEGDESATELVSNASRIGLKGGEQINDGLKAIYQFEYQTEIDDGANGSNNQTFGQRNIWVGLQGNFGTLIGGKFDTPVKTAQEKIDLFNDLEGDINFLVDGDTRSSNIVQYTTPLFANKAMAVNIAYVSAEKPKTDTTPEGDDGISVSLTYTGSNFFAAVATEQDVTAQGMDIIRAVGRYTWGAWQFGGLVEQSETDTYDGDAWLASVKYNLNDKFALKAQFGNATDETPTAATLEGEDKQFSVGFDYLLSKNFMLFGYYTKEDAENTTALATTDQSDNWLGVGVELKF